jgi:hypothetical protein
LDNPYWFTQGRTHNIDLGTIKRMCFELLNIVCAGRVLTESFKELEKELEAEAAGEERKPDPIDMRLHALHVELAEDQISDLLLQISLLVRTYDDILKNSDSSEAYAKHIAKTRGDNYVGTLSGGELNLREACNKIIHATEIRSLYDRIEDDKIWFVSGEVELSGRFQNGRPWQAVIYIEPFVEIVLDRIEFGYPCVDPRSDSSKCSALA